MADLFPAPTTFIFRPGATSGTRFDAGVPVYSDWDALYTDLTAASGNRVVILDDSLTSPVPIPAGTYNLAGVTLTNDGVSAVVTQQNQTQVTWATGTELVNASLVEGLVFLATVISLNTPLRYTTAGFDGTLERCVFTGVASADAIIAVSGGGSVSLHLREVTISGGAGGEPLEVSGTTTVNLLLYSTVFPADTIVGIGTDTLTATVLDGEARYDSTQVGFAGTKPSGDLVGASKIPVDDSGWSNLPASTDLQSTLDDIDTAVAGEDLAATLVLGNITGGTDIALVQGDAIVGYNDPGATDPTRGTHILFELGLGTGAGLDGALYLRDGDATVAALGPRGEGAIDFQNKRGVFGGPNASYASGRRSVIPGGYANTASGNESFASGFSSVASGDSSAAFNGGGLAAGAFSFSANYANLTYGNSSAAFGIYNIINAPPTLAWSYSCIAGGYNNITDAQNAGISGGSYNQILHHSDYDVNGLTGQASHAEGQNNRAYGYYSHTEGFNNRNYGKASHLAGWSNLLNPPAALAGWTTILQASWDIYRAAEERPYAMALFGTSQAAHVQGTDNTGLAPGSAVGGRMGLTTIPGSWVWGTARPTTDSSRYREGSGTNQTTTFVLGGESDNGSTALLFTWDTTDKAYWVIRQNSAQKFRIEITAVADTSTATGIVECAGWEFSGLVRRDSHVQAGVTEGGTGSFTVIGIPAAGVDYVVVAGPLAATVNMFAVAGPRTPGLNDFSIDSGTTAGVAIEIAAAINDIRNSVKWVHVSQAVVAGSTVNLDSYPLGAAGNAVMIASINLAVVTISGGALTGGVDSTTTLVGLSSMGLTNPLYADAGATGWRVTVSADAVKQSVDIELLGQAGKRINCTAVITTAETGRNPK
jgi:hypothetical protein